MRNATNVTVLRNAIIESVESKGVSQRFHSERIESGSRFLITDTFTGNQSIVRLCDYKGVMQVLKDLFE